MTQLRAREILEREDAAAPSGPLQAPYSSKDVPDAAQLLELTGPSSQEIMQPAERARSLKNAARSRQNGHATKRPAPALLTPHVPISARVITRQSAKTCIFPRKHCIRENDTHDVLRVPLATA